LGRRVDCKLEVKLMSLIVVVSGKQVQTEKYDESRVWMRQAPNKPWLNIHLHRSVCTQ